jgi:hypothetical protein
MGILGYSNECHFMKAKGDDGNPANAPDIVDVDSGNPVAQAFSTAEQPTTTALPTREPIRTSPYLPTHGLVPPSFPSYGLPDMDSASTNDMSGASPDNGQSNRPTPTSSTASENRQNLTPGVHMNHRSGGSSFETSPVVPHQTLNLSPAAAANQGEVDRGGFYGDPSPFSIPSGVASGLTPPGQRFAMPDTPGAAGGHHSHSGGGNDFSSMPPGWPEMASQSGMTPVGEGVMRSIMLGPIETMDLGWDPNA